MNDHSGLIDVFYWFQGSGYLEFATTEEADAAFKKDGDTIMGRFDSTYFCLLVSCRSMLYIFKINVDL